MKKVSLIINAVIILAVAGLYILYFLAKPKGEETTDEPAGIESMAPGLSAIAFVNFDTLLLNYDMYHDMRNKLADKQKSSEAELSSESQQFEKEAADFQDKIQKGLVTRSRAQELEQQLLAEQQRLLQLKDDLSLELLEEEQVMNRQLLYNIMEFIEEYNKKHNFQYVLSNTLGGALLYANDSLDITNEVLKGLNAKYNQEREQ